MRKLSEFLHGEEEKDEAYFNKKLIKAIESSLPDKFCWKKAGTLADK